jgi:hypothetical protein
MPTSQDRYLALIARAAFNCEMFRGTFQDLSPAQRAMTVQGAPTWGRIDSWPTLKQLASADGAASGAVARIVDVTADFSIEWSGELLLPEAGTANLISQVGATGGFRLAWDAVNTVFVLTLYTNAGAVARTITTPAASAPLRTPVEIIIRSTAGGTAGAAWIRGTPVVATLGGAGVAANIGANSAVVVEEGDFGLVETLEARVTQDAWSNEDVAAIHSQVATMTGGEV